MQQRKPMNRGKGFTRPQVERAPRAPLQRVENCRGVIRPVGAAVVAVPKEPYFHSEAWRRAVASLPCVLCGKHDDTQCAHRNEGKAGGKKLMDDVLCAALCVTCHSAIDSGRDFEREERRARMDKAILLTIRELARAGLIDVVRTKV